MRIPPLLLVLLGLLAPAVAAAARAVPQVPAVRAPASVRVGGEYVTELPDLPAGVDECELFLLPDDGSGRMIQLTPEREAVEGPLRWRMPRVAAARARLVLRAGGRFGETESPPSAPFAVEPSGSPALAELLRAEGELAWHFGTHASPGPTLAVPAGAATLASAARIAVAVEPSRDGGVPPPALSASVSGGSGWTALPAPSLPPASRRPAFVPLRN